MGSRAPFPWFGGKSRVADIVWSRFGDVSNYVEPFFGSGAVLLARPDTPRTETINDADCYVANFWRAIKQAPNDVAEWANWPVNEADLQARHLWLTNQPEFHKQMKSDPAFYDAKVAGWWVWGICQWIGGGWCAGKVGQHLPQLGSSMGVHRKTLSPDDVRIWFSDLSQRLRRVRVSCGDWTRIMGPTPTTKIGLTGIFLDPPYADTAGRHKKLYTIDSQTVAHDVRAWAVEHGDDPKLRIALCGYEGEHEMPPEWECVAWKAQGGYASMRKNGTNENRFRERIWFSPNCLRR